MGVRVLVALLLEVSQRRYLERLLPQFWRFHQKAVDRDTRGGEGEMSEDIEQQQKTLEIKVGSLESQVTTLQNELKQTKNKSLEPQINNLKKELKQTKDRLSAINKIANRGKIL